MGSIHAENLHTRVATARLAAVSDVDAERAGKLAEQYGSAAVFTDGAELIRDENVEAVVIASPDPTHAPLVLECLKMEKPVLCEKPLADSAEAALEVVEAEVELGRKLVQVGFMRRYDPQHVAVARKATEGEIGRPLMFKGVHRAPEVPTSWDSEFVIRNALVHDLDSARWMLGQEIEEVFVRGVNNDPALGEVFVTARYGYEVNAELLCERGIAQTPLPHDVVVRSAFNRSQRVPEGFLGRFSDAYEIEVEQWIDALRRGEGPGGADAWDGYISLVASEGCVESLKTGSPQRLEKPERPKLYRS